MTKLTDQVANTIHDTIATADSAFPVAIVQYLINGVHSVTGLNWWASIVITTLLVHGVTVPLLIMLLKANSKFMLMRPRLEEIHEQMQAKGMKLQAIDEGKKKMKELFDEYGVTPSTLYKEVFIQSPIIIISYLDIANMTINVPSFKTGGALSFTDLTTPDDMYIFPILTSPTFLVPVENFQIPKMDPKSMAQLLYVFFYQETRPKPLRGGIIKS